MNAIYKALADENRRMIIKLLLNKPLNAGEIGENFSFSAPSLTHHLNILVSSGILSQQRAGQNKIFSIEKATLQKLVLNMYDKFEL